jgi:hypothetical protein
LVLIWSRIFEKVRAGGLHDLQHHNLAAEVLEVVLLPLCIHQRKTGGAPVA